jgi:hypothetical protein
MNITNNAVQAIAAISMVTGLLVSTSGMAGTPDEVDGVTITAMNLYAGTTATGAFVVFAPAKPNMGGCLNALGNVAWIDWSSLIQPDGKALYDSLYNNYRAGKTVSLSTNGCTSDGYYPIVIGISV